MALLLARGAVSTECSECILELIVAAVELADDEIASRGFVYQYARGAGTQSKTHTNRQQGQVLLCFSHRLYEELQG